MGCTVISVRSLKKHYTVHKRPPGLKAAFVFGNIASAAMGFALVILSLILAWDALQAFNKARSSLKPAAARV